MQIDLNPMKRNFSRLALLLLATVLVAGCTTNSLVIGFFYGRLDNRMAERILEAANFTDVQKTEIQQSVDDFFSWHRRTELPRYRQALARVAADVEAGRTDPQTVNEHMLMVRGFTSDAFRESPFARSADFLGRLSDRQVQQIAAHFAKKDEEFQEWYRERQEEGSDEERVNRIAKNVGRFGIQLNEMQKGIIADALDRIESDPLDRHALWNRWEAGFVEILARRDQPGFEDEVTSHLAVYQDQMRLHRPQVYQKNQQVIARMISDIVQSLDPRQRAKLINRLNQAGNSLGKVAAG